MRLKNQLPMCALLLLACGGGDEKAETETSVAFLHPFSGALAGQALDFELAYNLALKDINDQGGINKSKLVLDARDTQTDPVVAGAMAQEVIDQGHTLIVGDVSSSGTAAILEKAVPAGVLDITGVSQAVPLAKPENDGLFFRPTITAAVPAELLAETVASEGHTKIAIISSTNQYTRSMASSFAAVFPAQECAGGACEITTLLEYDQAVDVATFDFDALIDEALASGADGLMISSYPNDGVELFEAAWNAGYHAELYTTEATGNENVSLVLPDDIGNSIRWASLKPITNQSRTHLEGAWASAGGDPSHLAGPTLSCYDAMFVLGLAIAHAGSTDARAVSASMYEVANAPGEVVYAGEWSKAAGLIAAGTDIQYEGVASSVDFDEIGNVYLEAQMQHYVDKTITPM
jgi:branched-chain amino acid transport system substrate-binding protein